MYDRLLFGDVLLLVVHINGNKKDAQYVTEQSN